MLKIEVNQGDTRITAGGDLREVVADFAIAVHHVFNILNQDNADAAAAFKIGIQGIIADPGSSVFKVTGKVGEGMAMIVPVKDQDNDISGG